MAFWKDSCADCNSHFYLNEDDCKNNKSIMRLIRINTIYEPTYVIDALIGQKLRGNSFKADSFEAAKDFAVKWLDEQYSKYIEELDFNLFYAKEEREEISKYFN